VTWPWLATLALSFLPSWGKVGIVCREVCLGRSERALTNYLHIFEILQEEAARAHVTFRELVRGHWVRMSTEPRLPPGNERNMQRLESDAEAVQVMTVHKAKGLEADVVFCMADCIGESLIH